MNVRIGTGINIISKVSRHEYEDCATLILVKLVMLMLFADDLHVALYIYIYILSVSIP